MTASARTIVDAGETIGGREIRALCESDLERMDPAEAETVVRKDSIWPPPDWRALVADGMEPRAAALVKLVRDRIPTRPKYAIREMGTHYTARRERDPDQVRRDYLRMLSAVRDTMLACRTVDDVRDARSAVLEAVGWTPQAGHDIRHLVTSVWRDRQDTLQIDYRDMTQVEAMIREGWPGSAVPTWRRGYVVLGDGEGGHLLAKGVRIVADGFPSEAAAWEWLRRETEARRSGVQRRPAMPSRPIIAEPVRTGLPERRSGDVAVLGFIDAFGLRAVEFGKWVPHAERQILLNRAFDALHDLADAIGLPPESIGLGGTLALSFGARGAGTAKAVYDPGLRVVALPRASGAGELARCWALAFDHWAGELDAATPSISPKRASGHAERGREPVPAVAHLPSDVAKTWERLTYALWRNDPSAATEAAALREDISRCKAAAAEAERQRDEFLARSPAAASSPEGKRYLGDIDRWLRARRETVIPGLSARLQELEERGATESSYAAEARKLCGRDGDFWGRPTEVLARAFETYVHDRLEAMGGRNEFLVHGVEEDRFSSGFRGNPYPAGEERGRIRAALEAVIAAMRPRLVPENGVNMAEPPGPAPH